MGLKVSKPGAESIQTPKRGRGSRSRLKWYSIGIGVFGLVLSAIGLFLPWIEFFSTLISYLILGIEMPLGRLSLVGLSISMAGLFLILSKASKVAPAVMAAGGLIMILCALAFYQVASSKIFHYILYGWLVHLIGGIIVMIAAALSAIHVRRKSEVDRSDNP